MGTWEKNVRNQRQLPMKRKCVKTVNVVLSALIKCHTQKDYNISHPIANLIYIQLREILSMILSMKNLQKVTFYCKKRTPIHQVLTSLDRKENMSFKCCY